MCYSPPGTTSWTKYRASPNRVKQAECYLPSCHSPDKARARWQLSEGGLSPKKPYGTHCAYCASPSFVVAMTFQGKKLKTFDLSTGPCQDILEHLLWRTRSRVVDLCSVGSAYIQLFPCFLSRRPDDTRSFGLRVEQSRAEPALDRSTYGYGAESGHEFICPESTTRSGDLPGFNYSLGKQEAFCPAWLGRWELHVSFLILSKLPDRVALIELPFHRQHNLPADSPVRL